MGGRGIRAKTRVRHGRGAAASVTVPASSCWLMACVQLAKHARIARLLMVWLICGAAVGGRSVGSVSNDSKKASRGRTLEVPIVITRQSHEDPRDSSASCALCSCTASCGRSGYEHTTVSAQSTRDRSTINVLRVACGAAHELGACVLLRGADAAPLCVAWGLWVFRAPRWRRCRHPPTRSHQCRYHRNQASCRRPSSRVRLGGRGAAGAPAAESQRHCMQCLSQSVFCRPRSSSNVTRYIGS